MGIKFISKDLKLGFPKKRLRVPTPYPVVHKTIKNKKAKIKKENLKKGTIRRRQQNININQ